MNVLEVSSYKEFLKQTILENKQNTGYKGKLAQAAGCQRAYLSQVLGSHVHLTPDHAAGLALFWGLVGVEREYFLELVNHARAATPALRKILEDRMETLRRVHGSVAGRIKKPTIKNVKVQTQYYSAWHYAAIHILLTIEGFRSPAGLAQRLALPISIVNATLEFLAKAGLAEHRKNEWVPLHFDLHLPGNSPLSSQNHFNWRMQAIQDSQDRESNGVHFTSVYTLSRKDYSEFRAKILDTISASRRLALESAEEDMYSFCCDLFRV